MKLNFSLLLLLRDAMCEEIPLRKKFLFDLSLSICSERDGSTFNTQSSSRNSFTKASKATLHDSIASLHFLNFFISSSFKASQTNPHRTRDSQSGQDMCWRCSRTQEASFNRWN